MYVKRANVAMDCSRMCFGGVVAQVFLSWVMMEFEGLLGLAVEEPKVFVLHRARSGSFLRVVNDTYTCAVVDVDWRGWLRVSELVQG